MCALLPYFFASMIRELKQRPGATLREKFEDFAVRACGLMPDEVAAIRRNLCDAGKHGEENGIIPP